MMGDWLWKNPVLVKEFRTRMRANRAFVILTAHLLFLGLVVMLTYLLFRSASASPGSLDERRLFGKVVFGLVIVLELIMVSFTAPALTASAVSTERERQTYDLLRATLLPANALVGGKYAAGLIFIFLLLFTAIPFTSPALLFGGVLPEEIAIGVLVLATTAIAFCAMGIFLSSLLKRTLIATVLAYAFAIFLVFGIPLIVLFTFTILETVNPGFDPNQLTLPMRITLVYSLWLIMAITPLATIVGTEAILIDQQSAFWSIAEINSDLTLTLPSPWILYVLIYLLLSGIMLWASVRLIRRIDS